MTEREAHCCCGALRVKTTGEPVRISVCHCTECQRRTGSAFGVQARFPEKDVAISGASSQFRRKGDSGGFATMHFCPTCGSIVFWRADGIPGFVTVAVGAFADSGFPTPTVSVYGERKHGWVAFSETFPIENME